MDTSWCSSEKVQLFKREIYDKYQMGKNNPILYIPENERDLLRIIFWRKLKDFQSQSTICKVRLHWNSASISMLELQWFKITET